MKKLIEDNDLGLPLTTPLERYAVRNIKWLLGLNKLNSFYDQIAPATGIEFAHKAIEKLDVKSIVSDVDVEKIPTEGGVIIIANYPHGALDGLLMIDTIVRRRPDAKFVGNFILSRLEPIGEFFISVDPFESSSARNIPGVRSALQHLRTGGALIIFPSAEVATYRRALGHFDDRPWPDSIVRFIRSSSLPVVPIHISGRNSLTFHLLGKIHPRLRTLRLVRELLNKQHKTIEINIGYPISTRILHSMGSDNDAAAIMRANISILNVARSDERSPIKSDEISTPQPQITSNNLIIEEINALPADTLLSSLGSLKLYFCTPDQIEHTLKQICELRKTTFSATDSKAINAVDTDAYDTYYHHLFIWDSEQLKVVGAYRVGFGEELFQQMGVDAFYTHTLFDFSHKFFPVMRSTIEIGRSFIVTDYQHKAQPMLLLWRGLLMILMRSEGYRYMMGAVSIPNDYAATARRLMTGYIKAHHWSIKYSRYVIARHGIRSLSRPLFDTQTLSKLNSSEYIDKFIHDIDPNHPTMPALLKRYLQLGGEVLSLNVDSKFNDSLEALTILDINKIDPTQLELLTKEFNNTDTISGDVPRGTNDITA